MTRSAITAGTVPGCNATPHSDGLRAPPRYQHPNTVRTGARTVASTFAEVKWHRRSQPSDESLVVRLLLNNQLGAWDDNGPAPVQDTSSGP